MGWREEAKKKASVEAVKHVKAGFTIGLGSGNTVAYAIQEIGKRVQQRKLRILGVPTAISLLMLDFGPIKPISRAIEFGLNRNCFKTLEQIEIKV